MFIRRVLRHIAVIAATALLGGLLTAALVRYAPGYGVGDESLNAQLTVESKQQKQSAYAAENNVFRYYVNTLSAYAHGDLGVSHSFERPVRELISERAPQSLRSLAFGLLGGWVLGLAFALPFVLHRSGAYEASAALLAGIFLCFPAAALALVFLLVQAPTRWAIALLVFPKVFRTARNLLLDAAGSQYVLAALASGNGGLRLLRTHLLPNIAAPMLALAGATITLAFSVLIPIEVVCGEAGLGELAWRAALGRDLPLLLGLTLIVAVLTVAANSISDFAVPAEVRA